MREKAGLRRAIPSLLSLGVILWLVSGCTIPVSISPMVTPSPTISPAPRADGLSEQEVATLGSLQRIDDYPLYTMHHAGAYDQRQTSSNDASSPEKLTQTGPRWIATASDWACSLFAALGDPDAMLYGRNFDWEYSPALLLVTHPPDGHASISMVDIAYLGFRQDQVGSLNNLPLIERKPLLDAPFLPFDGMNERGLVVGMAAVPAGGMRPDPNKKTIGSLGVIRKILDQASTVDEAVSVLERYNVDMEGGPHLHYLIADQSGQSVLVEFYQGESVIIPNENPWHLATNFLRASTGATAEGKCWRYDTILQNLTTANGQITTQEAINVLADVAQEGTQWSIVYEMNRGYVNVVMGRRYKAVHTLATGFTEE